MSSDSDAGPRFTWPKAAMRLMGFLSAIASHPDHPRVVTAFRLFALLVGRMDKSDWAAGGFAQSAELTALLTELAELMGPPTTTESLRQWAANLIEVMPRDWSPIVVPRPERPN